MELERNRQRITREEAEGGGKPLDTKKDTRYVLKRRNGAQRFVLEIRTSCLWRAKCDCEKRMDLAVARVHEPIVSAWRRFRSYENYVKVPAYALVRKARRCHRERTDSREGKMRTESHVCEIRWKFGEKRHLFGRNRMVFVLRRAAVEKSSMRETSSKLPRFTRSTIP